MTGQLYGAPPAYCDDRDCPCKRTARPTPTERAWQLDEIWRSAQWAADVRNDPPDGVTPAAVEPSWP